jgi:hypothetical protein
MSKYSKNLKLYFSGEKSYVKSYDTLVAEIDHVAEKIIQLGDWSMATQKHINFVAKDLGYELVKP